MPWPLAPEVTITGKWIDPGKHSLKVGFPMLIKVGGRRAVSLGKITDIKVKGDVVTLTVKNG